MLIWHYSQDLKWSGTILQCVGVAALAANLSWSPWAFVILLAGSLLNWWSAWLEYDRAMSWLFGFFTATNILGIMRWIL